MLQYGAKPTKHDILLMWQRHPINYTEISVDTIPCLLPNSCWLLE